MMKLVQMNKDSNPKPQYLNLFQIGELEKRVEKAKEDLNECNLCPHQCQTDRRVDLGACRSTDKVVVSNYGPHLGEEPPLVGKRGSGTIFFAYCNMKCVFCQNCEISFAGEGQTISNQKLADIMLKLQNDYRCHNINLVTPTHFVPNILEALLIAVNKGLRLPLVYNCGGYEKLETLKLLDQVIDIYMPDFKYNLEERGIKYSKVPNYPQVVQAALKEMDHQVGGLKTDEQGIAYRGLIIRHLMMPGGLEDTKSILSYIKKELSPGCLVNLMDQYHPEHQAYKYQEISRNLSSSEYLEALEYAKKIGLSLVQ